MVVGESIEASSTALGVSSHLLKVEPVTSVEQARQFDALGDNINSIAGRAPDGVSDILRSRRVRRTRLGSLRGTGENLGNRVLVVENDIREIAVDAVVQVQHECVTGGIHRVGDITTRDHVGCQGVSGGYVVATGLGNDTNVRWEVGVHGFAENACELLETVLAEAAADIQSVEFVADLCCVIEDHARILDGFEECARVLGTRSNVEADSDNLEVQFVSKLEERTSLVHGSTELHAQPAQAGRVIGQDAKVELRIGESGFDFVQLIGVVKSHLLNANLGSVAQVGLGLAGLRVDDAAGINARLKGEIDLRLGGTVETISKLGHEAQDFRIRIAFNSC